MSAPAIPQASRLQSGTAIGLAFAAIGALFFGSKGIAVKIAYTDGIDAETLLALRFLVALPFYLGIGAFSLAARRKEGKAAPGWTIVVHAMALGILGYSLAGYADFKGLEYISVQYARVVIFTYPLFVVVLGALFFGQPIRPLGVLATAIGYSGILVMFSEQLGTIGDQALFGTAVTAVAAISMALFQLLAKKAIPPLGSQLFTSISMTGAAICAIAPFVLTHSLTDMVLTPKIIACALYLGICATVLPTFFMVAALSRISATANSTIGMLAPAGTIFLADVILGEKMTPIGWAGTALVVAGVSWFAFVERKR